MSKFKGLNSLIKNTGDIMVEVTNPGDQILLVSVDDIERNPYQPRTEFDQEKLEELAESIKESGLLTPPIVIKGEGKKYQLIAGERRLRASILAGLTQIKVILRVDTDAKEQSILAVIENVQREDLNSLEIALSYSHIMKDFSLTQQALAVKMGKSRSSIANHLRLLELPEMIKSHVSKGDISFGHAKILSGLKDEEKILVLGKKIVDDKLSVKELNSLSKEKPSRKETVSKEIDQTVDSSKNTDRRSKDISDITTFLKTLSIIHTIKELDSFTVLSLDLTDEQLSILKSKLLP